MKNQRTKTLTFLISQAITLFGSSLVQMAVIWYVTLHTEKGAWVAAFTVASYLPQFLISFMGGVLADRFSRKKLIIGADAGIAAVTLMMFFVMPKIGNQQALLSLLLLMSAIRSLGAGIQTPAVNAVLPQLVPEDKLMRYNGINATMQSIVQFAAPAAAGVVLSMSTLNNALLIDIITAVVGIGMFMLVKLEKQESCEKVSMISDMREGIKYTLSHSLIRKVLLIFAAFIFLSVPAGFLAQLYVSRTFGSTYWYLTALEVIGFIGMAIGGGVMSIWGGFKRRMKTLMLGTIIFGALAIGMGFSKSFVLYLSLMLIYGIALTMVQTSTTTIIQENADSEVHGRVFGLLNTIFSGFLPLGMIVFGPLSDVIPLKWIMIGSGVFTIILSAACRDKNNAYNKT